MVRSNQDMGNDYIIEFTPPTTEEIRNARPLATVLRHDALSRDCSHPVRGFRRWSRCLIRPGARPGAIGFRRFWKRVDSAERQYRYPLVANRTASIWLHYKTPVVGKNN